jgi:general secretion pathway protein K
VVFKSKNEMKAIVGTKSKMFSIYSEGVIPSYKRETRVSVHAVVDFRNATDVSQMSAEDLAKLADPNAAGGTSSRPSTGTGALGEEAAAQAAAALTTNPAGNLVYWRIQ